MKTVTIALFACAAVCEGAELLSRAPLVSQTAAGASYATGMSANGRYIAFSSVARNLVTNNTGGSLALFLHDTTSGQTRLFDDQAAYPSFSADGELFAFVRQEEGINHIFLHDLQNDTTTWATTGSQASPHAPLPIGSSRPMLTPDGRWLLFESSATNLVSEADTNGLADLFLRDLQSGSNILVSPGAIPRAGLFRNERFDPSLSSDGRRVAFLSRNIAVPTTNTALRTEVLVRDVPTGTYLWASTNVEAILGWTTNEYVCSYPVLSADGNIVAFKVMQSARSTNSFVLRHDLQAQQTTVIGSNSPSATPPALSADGRYLAYESSLSWIFRYDADTARRELVSINAAGSAPANGLSLRPVMTPNGGVVAFLSSASNLTVAGNPAMNYQIYLRDMTLGATRLVSANTNGQPALMSLQAAVPEISADGMRVVFDYTGSDLAAGDVNDASDVFIFNAAQGTVELISKAAPELPARTSPTGVASELTSIADDGSKVTFTASDIPGFPGDTNRQRDVFVADLNAGTIEKLSTGDSLPYLQAAQGLLSEDGQSALYFRHNYGTPPGSPYLGGTLSLFRRDLGSGVSAEVDPASAFRADFFLIHKTFFPAISREGNLVVYYRSGLLYLKDMVAGTNQIVAQSRANLTPPFGRPMLNPSFTPDSRWVLFQHSWQMDLTTNRFPSDSPPGNYNLFARDLSSREIIMLSVDQNGGGMGTATAKSISSSGRYVAYDASVTNLFRHPTNIYVFDFVTRQNTLICSNCSDPSMSGDARLVAYAGLRSGTAINDIYVKDRVAGTVVRIGDSLPNDGSSRPLLSADGRYVVFTSKASNYVADDDNGAQDVFLHDRYRGVTYRLSAGSAMSARPVMSRDGRTVVFQSFAGDLSPGDYNEALDIFSVRLGAGDADNDGMDDAWEVTYFNTTSRDGAGDFDSDGHSDFQEFLSGTDPTNVGSVLEVLAIRSLNPGQVRVLWTAVAGKKYVIQSKASLNALEWTNESEPITADSPAMSFDLVSNSDSGFYRVVVAH